MRIDQEIKNRQQNFLSQIGISAAAVLAAGKECYRAREFIYPFRQNSDFYYLTGFEDPDAVAVFVPGRAEGEYLLFIKELPAEFAVWCGEIAGFDEICADYGVDQIFSMDCFDAMLPDLLAGREKLYLDLGRDNDFDARVNRAVDVIQAKSRSGLRAPQEYVKIGKILHKMRSVKGPKEIELIRKAVAIVEVAQLQAMQVCKPQLMEYELEAEIMREFFKNGSRFQSFVPIVAGGANTCILHYAKNNQKLQDGDLVLIDIGTEHNYYAADLTRTFPVNGKFSSAQKAIYQAVLATQLAVIEQIKPGVAWNHLQQTSEIVITKKLVELGILDGEPELLCANQAFKAFYMHNIGHWMGLDVHDVGEYRQADQWRILEPGMVLTVEPGIYVKAGTEGVDEKWWNIGVRIEDDILVTENGYEVLSRKLPKTVEEIENYMSETK